MRRILRAAIYARRSTEEHQADSLDTQMENARRFIDAHGWTLGLQLDLLVALASPQVEEQESLIEKLRKKKAAKTDDEGR